MTRLAVLVLLIWPAALGAETVSIRSGEHDRFSRLVLTIPAGTGWELGREERGYRLRLGDSVTGIVTEGVFDRIPRDRIAELSTPTSRDLSIALACDRCHADAFLWRPDRLVVDIVDGPPGSAAGFEAPLDGAVSADRMQQRPPGGSILPVLFDRSLPARPVAPFAPELDPGADRPVEAAYAPPAPDQGPPSGVVTEAELELLQTLSRAAAQGVVTIDRPIAAGLDAEPPPALAAEPEPVIVEEREGRTSPGLILRTGLEALEGARALPVNCPDPALFALADWVAPGSDFADVIGARRLALTTESGRVDPVAVEDLARAYLHFGFGREAVVALGQGGQRSAGRRILGQIARILDDEPLTDALHWTATGCSDGAILWQVLGQGDLEGLTPEDRRGAVRGFQALPNGLRAQLGPRLASILAEGGDPDTAEAILNGADLAVADPLPEQPVAAARIAIRQDDPDAAIRHLMSTTAPEARQTPAAIRDLIRLQIDEGQPVPDPILDLAGALRFEHRGTHVATELAIVEAEALIAAGRTVEALDLIETAEELALPEHAEDRLRLRSAAVRRRISEGSVEEVLDLAFGEVPATVDPGTQNLIAGQLIELGFAERAAQLLREPARGEDMAERRYLRAEAALRLDDPAAVRAALAGLDTDRAEALRVAAGPLAEDAALVLPVAGSDAEDAAWRAASWTRLATAEDPLLREAATAALTPPPVLEGAAPLAERQAVLEDAEATRALVSDLLTRFIVEAE